MRIAVAGAVLVLGLGLAACGTQAAPVPAPTQTVIQHKTIIKHRTIVVPAPAQPVVAQPAQPGGTLTACGGSVYAGPSTSCPFALNVASSYAGGGGPDVESVYSPVTGQSYVMTYNVTGSGTIVATGGNNAYVQF